MTNWQTYLQENRERFLQQMLAFYRIPSISSLPEHAPDVQRAAEWVGARLTEAGLEQVTILPTGGHPVVYGEWLHAPGKPTVLIYGHFDTQPVDPLALWDRPPFEPEIVGDRVYARGASDNKGNMLIPILAVEALLRTEGRLPVNVKFFLEGQEEIGSPHIPDFLREHGARFACDFVISSDSAQHAEDQPSLSLSSRGLCALQIDVEGAAADLHSGQHGGAVQNPIHALVQILASLRAPDGRILVPGFYDRVLPVTDEERTQIAAIPFDEGRYITELGVPGLFGEAGYTTEERRSVRPTLEVNGIWGGFQGAGVKTVLPNLAHAKITCRLVADQDPVEIVEQIATHVQQQAPPGVQVTVQRLPGRAKPYRMPADHPGNQAAHDVLTELYGRAPYYTRTGGTVPVNELFHTVLGAHTVSFGFALGDEQFHAPNEFFRLSSWEKGQVAYCKLLHRIANAS